ncbi:hypothetical protein C8J56DRAFT_937696 [Mycena floridula]|nr:hypothetical protein C8J56DRAFT_937696 [Mycena floridula]
MALFYVFLCFTGFLLQAHAISFSVPDTAVQGQPITITWTRGPWDPPKFTLVSATLKQLKPSDVDKHGEIDATKTSAQIQFPDTGTFYIAALLDNTEIPFSFSKGINVQAAQPLETLSQPSVSETETTSVPDAAGGTTPITPTSAAAAAAATGATAPTSASLQTPAQAGNVKMFSTNPAGAVSGFQLGGSASSNGNPMATATSTILSQAQAARSQPISGIIPPTSTTKASPSAATSNSKTPIIIGAILGLIILILLILLFLFCRRRRRQSDQATFSRDMMVRKPTLPPSFTSTPFVPSDVQQKRDSGTSTTSSRTISAALDLDSEDGHYGDEKSLINHRRLTVSSQSTDTPQYLPANAHSFPTIIRTPASPTPTVLYVPPLARTDRTFLPPLLPPQEE